MYNIGTHLAKHILIIILIPLYLKNKYISQMASHYNYFSQAVIVFHISLQYLFFTKNDG